MSHKWLDSRLHRSSVFWEKIEQAIGKLNPDRYNWKKARDYFLKICLLGVFYTGPAGASDYLPPCSVKKTSYGDIKGSAVESYFLYINEFLNYSYKRDGTMASLAVKQQGEGLIILGESHEKGVTTVLLSLCRGL